MTNVMSRPLDGNKRFREMLARGEFKIENGMVVPVSREERGCDVLTPPPKRRHRTARQDDHPCRSGSPSSSSSSSSSYSSYSSSSSSSSAYPSSGSEQSDVPSMRDVLNTKAAEVENKTKPGKKRRSAPTYTNCVWPRSKACCVHRCEGTPSSGHYNTNDVLAFRSYYHELSTLDRRHFMANRLGEEYALSGRHRGKGPHKAYYLDNVEHVRMGNLKVTASKKLRRVCQTFFVFALGVSTCAVSQPTSGTKTFVVESQGTKFQPRRKAQHVTDWLLDFAQYYQISPDNDFVYLPYADRASVYDMYKTQTEMASGTPASKTYFIALWGTEVALQHIRIRRWLRFALCDDCVGFRLRRSETMDHKAREAVKVEERAHHKFVTGERGSYYKRGSIAETHSRDALSVIIDGSDNSQYWSPYFREKTSSSQSMWKVGLHVMGAIVHGRLAYCYTILDTVPLGGNVTIDILHRVLAAEFDKNGDLPPVLYLQLDNTSRQCKNKYVMAWLAYLVHIGVFKEVYVSFLPKGHTHEDIDQMFSRIAAYLRKHDCPSPRAFLDCIRSAYTYKKTVPTVEHLTHVANISDWISDYIAVLPHISQWHQFQLRAQGLGKDKEVRLRVREWIATDDDRSRWCGLKPHEFDSAIFRTTDPATVTFLSTPPFGSTHVPPTPRKPKRTKTKMGDKEDRDPVARLNTDIENVILRRKIGPGDSESLREAVRILNADDTAHPLLFDWDTTVYLESYDRALETEDTEEKEKSDRDLEDVRVHHAVGSVWIVRSDFDSRQRWKKTPKDQLEMHWVVRVVGVAFRVEDSGEILIPVRYYENVGTGEDRSRVKTKRTKYQLGDITADLTPQDLQLETQLNAPARSGGWSFISHHKMPAVEHTTERWWRNAMGKYDVGRGGDGC